MANPYTAEQRKTLEEAAALIDGVAEGMDRTQTTCPHCSLVRYADFPAFNEWKALTEVAKRLRKFAEPGRRGARRDVARFSFVLSCAEPGTVAVTLRQAGIAVRRVDAHTLDHGGDVRGTVEARYHAEDPKAFIIGKLHRLGVEGIVTSWAREVDEPGPAVESRS